MSTRKLLPVIIAIIIAITIPLKPTFAFDGPKMPSSGGEGAPENILRFNPLSGNLLTLDKESETATHAYYKVKAGLGEPDKSFCDDFPTSCVIEIND